MRPTTPHSHGGARSVEISALRHAVPYLALFRGRTFVVKVGGGALGDARATAGVVEQLAALHHLGVHVVLVHGGGPQANELSRRLALEVRQVAGRRVTDAATLEVVTWALNGDANTRLLAACRAARLPAVGLSGVDADLVVARRRPPVVVDGEPEPVDYGFVGDVERVNPKVLLHLVAGGFVPVVSPLAADADGNRLNLNADGVAAALAVALGASKLILLTDAPGLLADPADPASLVSYLDLAGLDRLRRAGRITNGMLPKARAIEQALAGGIERAHLVSWRSRDAVLLELFTNEGAGTLVVPELAALSLEEREDVEREDAESTNCEREQAERLRLARMHDQPQEVGR
jgi:acetylglutamate kinase